MIAAGSIVIVSLALAYVVSPLFAGVTLSWFWANFCGYFRLVRLAKLLERMPWMPGSGDRPACGGKRGLPGFSSWRDRRGPVGVALARCWRPAARSCRGRCHHDSGKRPVPPVAYRPAFFG